MHVHVKLEYQAYTLSRCTCKVTGIACKTYSTLWHWYRFLMGCLYFRMQAYISVKRIINTKGRLGSSGILEKYLNTVQLMVVVLHNQMGLLHVHAVNLVKSGLPPCNSRSNMSTVQWYVPHTMGWKDSYLHPYVTCHNSFKSNQLTSHSPVSPVNMSGFTRTYPRPLWSKGLFTGTVGLPE